VASLASYVPVPIAFGATLVGGIVDVWTGQKAPAAIVIPALALLFAVARRKQSDAWSFVPLALCCAAFAALRLPDESVNPIQVIYAIFSVMFAIGAGIANMLVVGIACAIVGYVSTPSPARTRAAFVIGVVFVVSAAALCALAIRTAVRRPTERAWINAQPIVADLPDLPKTATAPVEPDQTRAYQVISEQRVRCGDKEVVRQRFDNGDCSMSYGAPRLPPIVFRGEPGDFGDYIATCGPARVRCFEAESRAIAELAETKLVVYVDESNEPRAQPWNGFNPKFAPAHVWWIWGVIGVLAAIGALVVRRPGFAVAFALFAGTPLAVALIVGRFA